MKIHALILASAFISALPLNLGQCEGDDDDTPTPAPDYGPPLPLAACDMAPYELAPRAEVGQLVEWEEVPGFNLTAEEVDALLEEAGYTQLSPVPYGCRVFRYRYTTQDRGVVLEATGLFGIPANADLPEEPLPNALYLHGTTGFSDPCAPSNSDTYPDGPAQAALVASLGFVAVAPDYIGMNGFGEGSETEHAYLVGEQAAIGSWDAMRAGKTLLEDILPPGQLESDDRVVIWGGSQGGHAALFTELYGPYYAPEFNVVAVSAMVPPSTLPPLVVRGLEFYNDTTTTLVAGMTAMREWYDHPADLTEVFTNDDPYYLADNAYDYVYPQEECNPGEGLDADEVSDIYTQGFIDAVLAEDWDAVAPWGCFFEENSVATSSVAPLRFVPTLMIYSEDDELVWTDTQVDDFDRLCAQGYQLEYLECQDAGHTDGALWSLPYQLDFINARLAGEPIDEDALCVRTPPVCCPASPEDVCTPE